MIRRQLDQQEESNEPRIKGGDEEQDCRAQVITFEAPSTYPAFVAKQLKRGTCIRKLPMNQPKMYLSEGKVRRSMVNMGELCSGVDR